MSFYKWEELPEITASNVQFQVIRKLVHLENVIVVSFEMEAGVEVPIHQHPHEQIGLVLQEIETRQAELFMDLYRAWRSPPMMLSRVKFKGFCSP